MKYITGIDHVGIRVYELATSRAFYESLGFEFLAGPVGPEPVAIMKHPSGVMINLILNAANKADKNQLMDVPTKFAGYTHVALAVDNADLVVTELSQLGYAISEGPIRFPTGTSLFIRDPDLNVIEFHEPAKVWDEMN